MEIWKDIKDFEGMYQVSNLGRVKSFKKDKIKGIVMNLNKSKAGYVRAGLFKNSKSHTKKVHRLVAEAFIPNIENKPFVNHINGVTDNNRVENLEWVTNKENIIHAHKIGLIVKTNKQIESAKKTIKFAIKKVKKKVKVYDYNSNNFIGEFESLKQTEIELGLYKNYIQCSKKRNYKKYKFEY